MIVNELEAAHQCVSPGKYLAALRSAAFSSSGEAGADPVTGFADTG
jgi:hypothetical protein